MDIVIFSCSIWNSFGSKIKFRSCLIFFRRSLPGLGTSFTFVGLILQLVHDLNKNVYTVNPRHDSNGSSLSGSSSGFVIVIYNVSLSSPRSLS